MMTTNKEDFPRRYASGAEDRAYWVEVLTRTARPVLEAMAEGKLHERMPMEWKPGHVFLREQVRLLEAIGRTICGIAPRLEALCVGGREAELQAEVRELAVRALVSAIDPESPDRVNLSQGEQPIVDGAILVKGCFGRRNSFGPRYQK